MTTRKIFVSTMAALMLCATGLSAQSPPFPSPAQIEAGEHLPPPLRVVQHVLQLDEAQTAEWIRLRQQTDPVVRELRDELREVETALEEELQSEHPSPGTVGQLVVRGHELKTSIVQVRRSAIEAFAAVLEQEQLGRLHFIQEAARVQNVLPAFREAGLIF